MSRRSTTGWRQPPYSGLVQVQQRRAAIRAYATTVKGCRHFIALDAWQIEENTVILINVECGALLL
jgi:hypothetical protein